MFRLRAWSAGQLADLLHQGQRFCPVPWLGDGTARSDAHQHCTVYVGYNCVLLVAVNCVLFFTQLPVCCCFLTACLMRMCCLQTINTLVMERSCSSTWTRSRASRGFSASGAPLPWPRTQSRTPAMACPQVYCPSACCISCYCDNLLTERNSVESRQR